MVVAALAEHQPDGFIASTLSSSVAARSRKISEAVTCGSSGRDYDRYLTHRHTYTHVHLNSEPTQAHTYINVETLNTSILCMLCELS